MKLSFQALIERWRDKRHMENAQATESAAGLGHANGLRQAADELEAALAASGTEEYDCELCGCHINPIMSLSCSRGTKCCTAKHP